MTRQTWAAPWLKGYAYEVIPLGDAGWYWVLYRDGGRVNGGLDETLADALVTVRACAERDHWPHYIIGPMV